MSSSTIVNSLVTTLPAPSSTKPAYEGSATGSLKGDGTFTPNTNIAPNAFAEDADSALTYSDPHFNKVVLPSTVALPGTDENPYLPINLPAYVSTLFANVANIQGNLTNDFSTDFADQRMYPTIQSVKSYVLSQLSGTETITNSSATSDPNNARGLEFVEVKGGSSTGVASTGVTTSLITSGGAGITDDDGNTVFVFKLGNVDSTRSGAQKETVNMIDLTDKSVQLNAAPCVTTDSSGISQIDWSYFSYMGQKYTTYQFVHTGDIVEFIQYRETFTKTSTAQNPSTHNNVYIVKNGFGGRFTNPFTIPDETTVNSYIGTDLA